MFENDRLSRSRGVNCDHVVECETEDEVMKRGAEQGKNVHGMKDEDFTPEFMQKVRGLIRTS